MAVAETAKLIAQLVLDDRKFTPGVNNAIKSADRLDKGFGRVGKGAGQISAGLSRAGLFVGGAVVAGLGGAAKAAIDFEDAFAGVKKTVEATPAELATLQKQFRDMATEIPIAATEFARLGEIAGALGVHVSAIDEFAEVTAKLGVTTDLTADAAADALGRIGNILNLTAEDYDNFGSALVNLGNKGASTEAEIIEITKRFAAAGKQAGFTTTDILGLAEATASFTGLAPEAAGSSLSRLAGTLTKITAGGGKKFKLLNEIVGKDFKKALDKDAGGALVKFIKGLGKLDKYERASALKTLGLDSVYLRQLLGGLTDNIDDVETSMDNADKGWKGNFLNEEAAKKFDTLRQKITLLKNNLLEAGITIGEGFTPALGRATDKLIAFLKVDANKSALRDLGKDIGAAIDSIDWKEVLDGAKDFVSITKVALDWMLKLANAVNQLPTEIKAAGLGFLALDKLSGGLLGAGAGNVLGGLAETFTRNLGAKLPGALGKAFVQPVFVTNMPVGGLGAAGGAAAAGGGLASKVGRIAGGAVAAVTIVGSALAVLQTQQEVSAQNTQHSQEIKTNLGQMLAQSPKGADLRNSLSAVRTGIERITSNPLHMLVQGEALANLRAMEQALVKQVSSQDQRLTTLGTEAQKARAENKNNADLSRNAIREVKTQAVSDARSTQAKVDAVRAAAQSTRDRVSSQVSTSGAATVSAIRSIPAPVINNHISISSTLVTRVSSTTSRTGDRSTSRDRNNRSGELR